MISTASVAVVIPYFQRQSGVLQRALRSVIAQIGGHNLKIIIVDDGSPAPPEAEISPLVFTPYQNVTVIRQVNAGAAAARNAALDVVGADIEFVAFLDSDDEWEPNHLVNAMRTLDQGYDFYFADYIALGQKRSTFERMRFDPKKHDPLDSLAQHFAVKGDLVPTLMLAPPVGTPTVVYRYSRFSGLRFDREFGRLGEDILFWIALVNAGARTCFTTEREVLCGRGINISQGATWGDSGSVVREYDMVRFVKRMLSFPQATDAVAKQLRRELTDHRVRFIQNMVHHLIALRRFDGQTTMQMIRTDPAFLRTVLPELARIVMRKISANE